MIGVGGVRTQITREVAKQACGTNSCSSPFIRVVITSFKRGGAVHFGEVLGPCPSPGSADNLHERHPRHIQHRPGACTMVMVDSHFGEELGPRHVFKRVMVRGPLSAVVLTEFQFRRRLSWVVTLIVGSDDC